MAKLGVAVSVAYASTYYLPAILAPAMAAGTGATTAQVYLAFSCALVISALTGPFAGRWVDRIGGRAVLAANNLVFALGLALLACAQSPGGLYLGWAVLGVAMGAGFYEATFAATVGIFGKQARGAITGITLIAGFASTVGWPLTAWIEAHHGWRAACLAWAALHLLVALPLHRALPSHRAQAGSAPAGATNERVPHAVPRRTGPLLALVFGLTWFVGTAMAAHLPALLQAHGVGLAGAVALGALMGPAQVAGRLLEFSVLRSVNPLAIARGASIAHACGVLALMAAGAPAGIVFTVLHGAGNGIMTIANGTLPLLFWGPAGYGARQGLLMLPARLGQAMAPFLFGLAIEALGGAALWLSAGLGLVTLAALALLRAPAVAADRVTV